MIAAGAVAAGCNVTASKVQYHVEPGTFVRVEQDVPNVKMSLIDPDTHQRVQIVHTLPSGWVGKVPATMPAK